MSSLRFTEHEIESASLKLGQCVVGGIVDLHDLAIEVARQIRADRGVIRRTLADI